MAWLSDRHINAAQKCLQSQFTEQSGLQDTLTLKEKLTYKSGNKDFVQIVDVDGSHWVCVSNKGLPLRVVTVYYSMHICLPVQKVPCLSRSRSQLFCIHRKDHLLSSMLTSRQKGTSECGSFAIAFAVALCYGLVPHVHVYRYIARILCIIISSIASISIP